MLLQQVKVNKKHRFLPGLLLVLFLSFQTGISLFAHTHIVNGIHLVHSHPSSDANHHHTSAQAYTIAFVSTFYCDNTPETPTTPTPFEVIAKIGDEITLDYRPSSSESGINFRAPPYC